MLEIGQQAPDFCVKNQDDIEICSRDLKGKWIVLYFYPKDLTPGCTTQACDFTEAEAQFDELDAIILGVSPDDTAKHRKFIEKKELSITLLSDESKKMCEDYGVWQLKKFMGKEFMGVVRTTFIINPEGKIAAIWDKVNVRKKKTVKGEKIEVLHVNEVKEKLQELQSK
ncbi:thioredoxin-dependent thiol peroxidase [Arcobacter arenosus]|uniref:Putative peroxiredoxin bcp n=1 Tax=Arcobacter arenosus TaxID=2576037 RepID=A0A5R8Y023_9BACT|nr:thioredoxin-dependent thiol peroxidase [Arcobacter arenosus]TLP37847.1 thioredoxin-dependent thiol peroxidase [Arcobacter arenosus]